MNMNRSLGIQKMPEGYDLILNDDMTHYFYRRQDGEESVIHWDKWAVYYWAKHDKALKEVLKK